MSENRFENWEDNPLTPENLLAEQSKYKERDYTEEDIDNFFISIGLTPEIGKRILLNSFIGEMNILPEPRIGKENIRVKDISDNYYIIPKEK